MDPLTMSLSVPGVPSCWSRLCCSVLPGVVLVMSVCGSAFGQEATAPIITVSEHTTRFTEPLNAQGFVDFAGAVNLKFRGDITPETNAAVPLYRAFGPHPEGASLSEDFYRQLGIDEPAEDGNSFRGLGDFARTHDGIPEEERSGPRLNELYDRMMKAPWTTEDLPTVAKWLQAVDQSLQLVSEGMQRSEYFLPLVPGVGEDGQTGLMLASLLPGVQMSREVARALVARAMWKLGEGQMLDAWSDLRICHRLGRLTSHGPTLIERLVGVAIENMAMQAEVTFLERANPTAGMLAVIRKDLAELPQRGRMVDALDVCERAMFLDVVQVWASGRQAALRGLVGDQDDPAFKALTTLVGSSIQWDDVLRNGNRWYDSMGMAMRQPSYATRIAAHNRIEAELKSVTTQFSDPAQLLKLLLPGQSSEVLSKQVSNVLISLLLPAVSQAQKAEDRTNQSFANLRVAIALFEMKSKTGEWPDSLQRLVPAVLEEVPNDLFSDAPLIYRREGKGFLLYSVGINQQDDGSTSYDDKPAADDLVIRVPAVNRPQ